MRQPIWLQLDPTNDQHGDVVLTFGGSSRVEDSYYFASDPAVERRDEDSLLKVSIVIEMLLHQ